MKLLNQNNTHYGSQSQVKQIEQMITLHGHNTIFAKTHWPTHLNRIYGIILSQFWFLDDMHSKCVWKSNSYVYNSFFGRSYV